LAIRLNADAAVGNYFHSSAQWMKMLANRSLHFQDGVAYDQDQKFLNTANPTLFQQLKSLTHPETAVGVPPKLA
jgi:hypothetical protein